MKNSLGTINSSLSLLCWFMNKKIINTTIYHICMHNLCFSETLQILSAKRLRDTWKTATKWIHLSFICSNKRQQDWKKPQDVGGKTLKTELWITRKRSRWHRRHKNPWHDFLDVSSVFVSLGISKFNFHRSHMANP